jgi:23S rRNA pseudouridine2605 synthase
MRGNRFLSVFCDFYGPKPPFFIRFQRYAPKMVKTALANGTIVSLQGHVSRNDPTPRKIGLARALSKLGYCSRSRAGELIAAGDVLLNGRVVRDPETPVTLVSDIIKVAGSEIAAAKKTYLMLNKPRGVVTSAHDEKNRKTVYSLLPEDRQWVAPVGRLDKASEGLLLLTNDSEWGAEIASPETHLNKTYHVQIAAVADQEFLNRLTVGVKMADGETLRVKRAAIVRIGKKNCWLEVVLDEGKNRQIRRLLSAVGVEVLRLVRIAIGPLQLADLAKGTVRELTREEKASLDRAMLKLGT